LYPLEEDIPTNEEESDKRQTSYMMAHEKTNQDTLEILEEKAPQKVHIQVDEWINIEYLLNPAK